MSAFSYGYGRSSELLLKRPSQRMGTCVLAVLIGFGMPTSEARAQVTPTLASAVSLKSLSIEELMNVEVISVSKRASKLSESPSSIQVVTNDDIRASGATNIPEALRLADNLDVVQKNSHDWGVSARGFNTELANKLLVMIDGRAIYTPLFSGVFWNSQDTLMEDIDRIEVVSGPGGSLWGANAVNGVINIISRNAKETQGLFLEAGGGSQLNDLIGGRYGTAIGQNVWVRVYGKYSDRDREVVASGAEATDASKRGQGGFRLDAEPDAATAFTLQGDYYSGHDEVLTGGKSASSGANLLGRWSRTLSADSDFKLQLYYDRTHLTDPFPPFVVNGIAFSTGGTLKDDLATYDFDFQHRFKPATEHEIVWGAGFRRLQDSAENAAPIGFFPAHQIQNLYSGFFQDQVSVAKDWTLTLGTKVEHNYYTHWEAEPSARLQWNPAAGGMLWTAVSRAVRTPSRIDRDLSEPTPPNLVILKGGPNFDSESVTAYELGYRIKPTSRAAASISVFYNDYDDVRSTSATPTTIVPLFFENNLAGQTHGLEFSGDYQVRDGWRLHTGFTLLREHIRIEPGKTDLNNALNETSDPKQWASLRSTMNLSRGLEWETGLRWVDARTTHNGATPGTIPHYYEMDMRVGWRPTSQLEFSIVGQNLLHDQHPEYGYPSASRVEIQRRIYGKAALRF